MALPSTLKVDQLMSSDETVTVSVKSLVGFDGSVNDMTYTAAATAVARSMLEKGLDLISVKDFGAKGDFTTDDTAAIQAALTYASTYSSRGALVWFPGGIYNVSGTLTCPKYVHMAGAGKWGTVIRCTASGTDVNPIVALTEDYGQLSGIGIVYASQQATSGTCLRANGQAVYCTDFYVAEGFCGIEWYNGSQTRMTDFNIVTCKSVGIQIGQSTTGFSNDLFLDNFFITSSVATDYALGAMRVLGHVEALVCSNADLIYSVYPFTSDPGSTSGLRFSRFTNVFFDSGTHPCLFQGVNNCSFSGCWWSNRAAGANWINCFSIDLSDVSVWNNSSYGFTFTGSCRQFSVSGVFGANNMGQTAGVSDFYVDATCSLMTFHDIHGYEAGYTAFLGTVVDGANQITLRDIQVTQRQSGYLSIGSGVTNLTVDGIAGYKVKAKGSNTLPASTTTLTITHGLAVTPELASIQLTPNGATVAPLYVSSVNATTFTVTTATANTGATPLSWQIDMSYR